jgi:hypothetical protein
MDLSFLLLFFFFFFLWGKRVGGGKFVFLFFCVLLFFFLLGFLMPYKTIGGRRGRPCNAWRLWTLEMDGNKLDLGWKQT